MFYDINVEESILFQESLPIFSVHLPPLLHKYFTKKLTGHNNVDKSQ